MALCSAPARGVPMQTMNLHMRDGEVIFHCTGCARDFYVDSTQPFVPQLRDISSGHHCYWLPESEEVQALVADLVSDRPAWGDAPVGLQPHAVPYDSETRACWVRPDHAPIAASSDVG
jgi:ribosomal protein L31